MVSTLPFLNSLLSSAQLPILHSLSIVVDSVDAGDFGVHALASMNKQVWHDLDNTLCLPRYKPPKRILVRFFLWDPTEVFSPVGSDVVKASLPTLSSRLNADFTPLPFPT